MGKMSTNLKWLNMSLGRYLFICSCKMNIQVLIFFFQLAFNQIYKAFNDTSNQECLRPAGSGQNDSRVGNINKYAKIRNGKSIDPIK